MSERQEAIRQILRADRVHSQGELLTRLRRRGLCATQPSVSRDLQEMRVAKVEGRYVLSEALAPAPRVAAVPDPPDPIDELSEVMGAVRRLRAAGPNILVVQTPPGRAPAVAVAIDRARWPEVAGTIAGDDTLLVLSESRRHQQRIEARLGELLRETARNQ